MSEDDRGESSDYSDGGDSWDEEEDLSRWQGMVARADPDQARKDKLKKEYEASIVPRLLKRQANIDELRELRSELASRMKGVSERQQKNEIACAPLDRLLTAHRLHGLPSAEIASVRRVHSLRTAQQRRAA